MDTTMSLHRRPRPSTPLRAKGDGSGTTSDAEEPPSATRSPTHTSAARARITSLSTMPRTPTASSTVSSEPAGHTPTAWQAGHGPYHPEYGKPKENWGTVDNMTWGKTRPHGMTDVDVVGMTEKKRPMAYHAGGKSHFEEGGFIPGQVGVGADEDERDVKAKEGEFIVPKEAAQNPRNIPLLEAMKRGEDVGGGNYAGIGAENVAAGQPGDSTAIGETKPILNLGQGVGNDWLQVPQSVPASRYAARRISGTHSPDHYAAGGFVGGAVHHAASAAGAAIGGYVGGGPVGSFVGLQISEVLGNLSDEVFGVTDRFKALAAAASNPKSVVGGFVAPFASQVQSYNPGAMDRLNLALDNLSASVGRWFRAHHRHGEGVRGRLE